MDSLACEIIDLGSRVIEHAGALRQQRQLVKFLGGAVNAETNARGPPGKLRLLTFASMAIGPWHKCCTGRTDGIVNGYLSRDKQLTLA